MYYSSTNGNNGNIDGLFMGYTTRIDVLDLLIEVLAGHEKDLDELVERLERAVATAERFTSA